VIDHTVVEVEEFLARPAFDSDERSPEDESDQAENGLCSSLID